LSMATRIVDAGNGQRYRHEYRPGPSPMGYIGIHAEIRPDQLATLKAINAECGGGLPVNEQIRRAIDVYLENRTGIHRSAQ